jgi:2-hydroxychromene-2-carboxylate isomerase
VWQEERDISDASTLAAMAESLGLDAAVLQERADSHDIAVRYKTLTDEAIECQVFGSPTYIYSGELFWGQDRLDFLERALAK